MTDTHSSAPPVLHAHILSYFKRVWGLLRVTESQMRRCDVTVRGACWNLSSTLGRC